MKWIRFLALSAILSFPLAACSQKMDETEPEPIEELELEGIPDIGGDPDPEDDSNSQ